MILFGKIALDIGVFVALALSVLDTTAWSCLPA